MPNEANTGFSFGEFEIDAGKRLLLRSGEAVSLNPKAFDLLCALVENGGRILSKNELLDTVWENQFVEENNLTVHVSALRKIFGEKKGENRFIATVPGRGYTFVARVQPVDLGKRAAHNSYAAPVGNQFDKSSENDGAADTRAEATFGGRNGQEDEIIIESRRFSRVFIEEQIEDNAAGFAEARNLIVEGQPKRYFSPGIVFPIAAVILIAGIGFWFWKGTSRSANAHFSFTKLTTSGNVTNAALTGDGKYAVFSQTEKQGESLWLRHIATGSQQQILSVKPVKYVGLIVSPDSNLIYATVFGGDMPDPLVWRVPLLGNSIEEIRGITTGATVAVSPDGRQIAFTESRSSIKETHLGIADSNGANKRILLRAKDESRSLPNFDTSPVAWSPGGGEIACVVEEHNADGATRAGIILVNPADGSERFISERRWDYIENLTWTDDENLAFVVYTNNPLQGQIWTVSKSAGEAGQITKDLESYARLASAGGNLLTVRKNIVAHISLGDFDERNNQINSREIFKESGYISNVARTRDGAVLYSSNANGKSEIWRVNADGSGASQLTVNANISFGLSISPVDDSIVFGSTENGRHFLKVADAEGRNIRALTEGAEDVYPNFTADGQSVIFQRGLNNKTITLWRVSLIEKNPVRLTGTHAIHPAISPDGKLTAYYFMDAETDNLWRIRLVSNESGAVAGKLNLPKTATERMMRWHPDGKFISQIFYEGNQIKLLLLPVNGGEAQIVSGLGEGDVDAFDWLPDGRQIVVSHTTETQDVVFLSK